MTICHSFTKETFCNKIWTPFSNVVSAGLYEKLKYSIWQTIQRWAAGVNAYPMINIVEHINCYEIYPSETGKLSPGSITIPYDDKSFGQFLKDTLVKCNMPTKNETEYGYSNVTVAGYNGNQYTHSSGNSLAYADLEDTITTNYSWCDTSLNQSLEDYIKEIVENINTKEKEEPMKFGNFDFGPVDTSIRMSLYGLAIKNASGTYVAYDATNKSVMDVDIVNFEGANKFMYKMPVAIKDVKVGDVVIHARKPMFVQEVRKDNRLTVMDIYDGEEKTIVLTKSPFGFDFVTKVVNLISFGNANAETPFGNMLPFLLLSDDKNSNDLLPFLFMGGNADMASNPMLMYALLNKDGKNDMLPFLLMSNAFKPVTTDTNK